MNVEQIIRNFNDRLPVQKEFTKKLEQLIGELLQDANIKFGIESRTKEADHLRQKLVRPGKSYVDPLRDITDLSGIPVVCHRLSDINIAISIIEYQFEIDQTNSVYKVNELKVDQFGYLSIHLVVSLNKARLSLPEWSRFKDYKAEVQLRTILQHAWAVVSHQFDYKVGADIPSEFRRQLYRLAALFEMADEELDRLVSDIARKIQEYKDALIEGKVVLGINVDSLRSYIETSKEVSYWNNFLRTATKHRVESWGDLSRDVRFAEHCGLKSIDDIDKVLSSAHGWGEEFLREYYDYFFAVNNTTPDKVTTVINGVVAMLLVATFIDKFTPEIMDKQFGWGNSFILLDTVKKVRSRK